MAPHFLQIRSFLINDAFISAIELPRIPASSLKNNGLEENQFDKDQYIKSLVKRFEEKGERTVLHIPNGNYIIFND